MIQRMTVVSFLLIVILMIYFHCYSCRIGTAAVLTGAVLAVTGGLAAPAIAGLIFILPRAS